jgi:hypothetical protein
MPPDIEKRLDDKKQECPERNADRPVCFHRQLALGNLHLLELNKLLDELGALGKTFFDAWIQDISVAHFSARKQIALELRQVRAQKTLIAEGGVQQVVVPHGDV